MDPKSAQATLMDNAAVYESPDLFARAMSVRTANAVAPVAPGV